MRSVALYWNTTIEEGLREKNKFIAVVDWLGFFNGAVNTDWVISHLLLVNVNERLLADFKSQKERDIYWTLLNFAQQFFDADE